MDKNIYLQNGYLNVAYIIKYRVPFLFIVGGRGTGKTYGALRYVLDKHKQFIYMRRTQSQIDIISKPEFSPFKAVCRDTGDLITSQTVTKYNSAFYRAEITDGKEIPTGGPIGYTMALSTVSNLRGFDASDVEIIIYDEFIPERHERPLKNEGEALLNAYETVNRNRELSGGEPVKLLALSNANRLDNPVFETLGLIDKAYRMERSGQTVSIDERRGIALLMLSESPISRAKGDTALYRLTHGSDFARMALDNSYGVEFRRPESVDLREWLPLYTVEGVTVYQHKSAPRLYVTLHKSGGAAALDPRLYKRQYAQLLQTLDARGQVIYESIAVREKLNSI